jgi:SAM-dependent methyltransferase
MANMVGRAATAPAVTRVLSVADHRDETKAAYDGVVELYASLFADRLEGQPFTRAMIGTFAELVRATGNPRAADAGCGPGHLTAMLHELGLDAFGLDLSPGMVDHARRAHPALHFHEAPMESLPVGEGTADAGLDPFARLLHNPASERGFLDAHLLARRS